MKRTRSLLSSFSHLLLASAGMSLGIGISLMHTALAENIDITLLHLNDIYEITPVAGDKSGGLSRVASLRRQLLQANPHTFVLLAGDALSPSALGTAPVNGERLAGQQIVAVLNTLGLNYATFGNHEFDITEKQFRQRLRESQFQWISSNVVDANGFPFWGVPVSKILNIQGKAGNIIQMGIFGVTIASPPRDYVQYRDAIVAAQLQVKNLQRQGADIIVALTHLSLAEDQQLAANVPEIDLILGGHEHENIEQWRLVGRPHLPKGCFNVGIPIFKADANVRTVYVHRLRYDTDTRCLTIASELRPITPAIPNDAKTEAEVQTWLQKGFAAFRAKGFEPLDVVTTTTEMLDGLESSVRNRPTNLTQLIATAMLQAVAGAELAIFNSGSIRVDDVLPPGALTQYDVIRILPFGGKILQVKMKGNLLQRVLEQGLANRGGGGYLHTANVTQDRTGKWQIQGQPLDPDRVYHVAINDFLLSGREQGLGFLTLTAPGVEPMGEYGDIRFAVIQQFQKTGATSQLKLIH